MVKKEKQEKKETFRDHVRNVDWETFEKKQQEIADKIKKEDERLKKEKENK